MTQFFDFAIIGLVTGALYALLGMGLTVVHRSSGVVNFSHGAVAVVAAYEYLDLTRNGFPTEAAALVSVASGFVLGFLIYGLVIRPLNNSSVLTKGIATLAVLSVLEATTTLRYGSSPQTVRSFLPSGSTKLAGASVSWASVITFAFCVVLLIVLTFVYRRTKFGMATTAVAEDEFVVALLGRSSTKVAALNWTIGCGLAAVAGITIAPLSAIEPALSASLLIPGLAVALCGRFASFPVIFASSLGIGIVQSELGYYSSRVGWLANLVGLSEALPFILVVLIVVFRSRSLPTRDYVAEGLPRVGTARLTLGAAVVWMALAVVLVGVLSDAWVIALTAGIVFGVMLLSQVVVTGYAGQLSLAQVAIAGVAVLVASLFVADLHWPMPLAALVGIAATVPIAFVIGLPALRTRGIMLGVVTLGLADALDAMLFQRTDLNRLGSGIPVGNARFFGIDLDQSLHPRLYAVFSLLILVIVMIAVANLRRSSVGKMLLAVRGNERGATALGVRVTAAKLYAFIVSGAIAGIGGLLAAWTVPNVLLNTSYGPFQSVAVVVSGTLSGIGFVSGAVLGGQVTQPGALGGKILNGIGLGEYLSLVTGLLLLVNMVFNPNGLVANTLDTSRTGLAKIASRFDAKAFSEIGRKLSSSEVATWIDVDRRTSRSTTAEAHVGELADATAKSTFEVRDLSVVFGATRAVDGISFAGSGGEVIGVIGANGSGKTTLIDAVSGYVPASGSVILDQKRIDSSPAWARNRLGISRSFQSLELFEELTASENLIVGAERLGWVAWLRCLVLPKKSRVNNAVSLALQEFGLTEELNRKPGELPHGKRRLLAICRALSTSTFPKVLLLDEPAAGLGDGDRVELKRLVRQVAEQFGVLVILVEHDVELVMEVSDRIVVLELGRKLAEGPPAEIRENREVRRSYLGENDPSDAPRGPRGLDDQLLIASLDDAF